MFPEDYHDLEDGKGDAICEFANYPLMANLSEGAPYVRTDAMLMYKKTAKVGTRKEAV